MAPLQHEQLEYLRSRGAAAWAHGVAAWAHRVAAWALRVAARAHRGLDLAEAVGVGHSDHARHLAIESITKVSRAIVSSTTIVSSVAMVTRGTLLVALSRSAIAAACLSRISRNARTRRAVSVGEHAEEGAASPAPCSRSA